MIRKLGYSPQLAVGLLSSRRPSRKPGPGCRKDQDGDQQNCSFAITLRPDLAPKHVEQIKKLAKAGFYDGIVFHRVIDGFMAQTGDPTGTGMGGSKFPTSRPSSRKEPFKRGTVGMARTQRPEFGQQPVLHHVRRGHFLNGQYTVWGQVTRRHGLRRPDRNAASRPQTRQDDKGDGAVMADLENTLYLDLANAKGEAKGRVVIELRPDLAPDHVARIKELAREGFYDGVVFHRVIEGFMAQTGDVLGNTRQPAGTGGSKKPNLKAGVHEGAACARHLLDGARAEPGFGQQPVLHLLRRRALPRQPVHGLGTGDRRAWRIVDKIKRGEPVRDPDKIVKMQVAADAK